MAPCVDKAQIKKAAEAILRSANITEPPVPVERIALLRGVTVKYKSYEGDLSGVLLREKKIIGINSLRKQARQRFTIAHELGHLEMNPDTKFHIDRRITIQKRSSRSSTGVDREEVRANAFAAELLMPESFLRKELEGHVVDYEDDQVIRRLAEPRRAAIRGPATGGCSGKTAVSCSPVVRLG
jgi:Zn-dependent peptidase ImmA (M78 family)